MHATITEALFTYGICTTCLLIAYVVIVGHRRNT